MQTSDDGAPRPTTSHRLHAAPMARSAFLRTAAGAALGSGFLLTPAAHSPAAAAPGAAPRALDVTKIADLTGPGLTTRFRMEATDLGVPARTPDGRTLFVFGDTFEQARVGSDWWRSPVALYSTTADLNGGVQWSGAVGGEAAQQLWDYEHDNPEFSTVLPSDVITIGDSMYLHVMVNKGLGNVVWTEIWRSDDSGATWTHTGPRFPPDFHSEHLGGPRLFQLLSWAAGDDGYVYVYSTQFNREQPIILHRVPAERIADPAAYEPWGHRDGAWAWGNPATPILDGRFGELCLRPLDGKWILTWFNAEPGAERIEGLLMDTPTSNLHTAYRQTLLSITEWGNEDDSHVAQLYGGYLIPGSTLDELHLAVSQWNTGTDNEDYDPGWPYRVMQFRVRGFGT